MVPQKSTQERIEVSPPIRWDDSPCCGKILFFFFFNILLLGNLYIQRRAQTHYPEIKSHMPLRLRQPGAPRDAHSCPHGDTLLGFYLEG